MFGFSLYQEFGLASIHDTGRNAYLIIFMRTCRMFAYGTNSLILAIFFSALKFSDHQIGLFMTLTLLGDVFLGTYLTLIADRFGRRNVLLSGSALMVLSGTAFAVFENFWVLLIAAIVGVISVTGGDFGPFRSIEESILSQLTTPSTRSDVLAWYVTSSALGSSLGSEAGGRIIHALKDRDGWTLVDAYHAIFWMLAFMGLINAALVFALSDACELQIESSYSQVPQDEDEVPSTSAHQEPMEAALKAEPPRGWAARLRSRVFGKLSVISAGTRSVMYKLWFLLAMDSLSDGMVPYSLTNYFMDQKFHPYKSTLGDITSISYLLSSIGSVFAGPLAKRIGLINTMVFSHAPSSAAVLFFPFPPVLWMAAALLMVRAGLNNMDQAPRAAFIAAVVKPEERTAVMGITATVRTIAAMLGPSLTGFLAAHNQFWIAFVIAGANRLLYDFGLYAMFVNTVLYEHEGKSNDLPNGRPSRDEEMVELESLADSDDSAMPEGESQTRSGNVHSGKSGLQLPGSSDRVRSRSPHRSRGSE